MVHLKEVLAREPSEVQLHFNRDTWKTLADTERAMATAGESAKQPSASPQQASEVWHHSGVFQANRQGVSTEQADPQVLHCTRLRICF